MKIFLGLALIYFVLMLMCGIYGSLNDDYEDYD